MSSREKNRWDRSTNKKFSDVRLTVVFTTTRGRVAYREGEPFYAFTEPFRDSHVVQVNYDYIHPLHMGLLKICHHLEPAKPHVTTTSSEDRIKEYQKESEVVVENYFPEGTYIFDHLSYFIERSIDSLQDMHNLLNQQVDIPRKEVSGLVPDEVIKMVEKAYLDGYEIVDLHKTKKKME
ncbi:hypothetical protein [Bacillus phage phiAGATE]|uniref:Uncharacterized protein n=1 Tax=Bacillus phage phiAGATE TaxID=1204533 RepID=L0L944_9CAUD|nr:hypothetical protein G380_gp175 [Bacillus phage phiAGATE]AGB62648.1 hypothetical protein [Bacillus phage phiAGATE]